MKVYRRNTHFENGEYRGDSTFLHTNMEFQGLGVHALDSKKYLTYEEYVESHFKYHRSFDDFSVPESRILRKELDEMIRIGQVYEKEIV